VIEAKGSCAVEWPVYLINLEKDRTRLEAATAELARVGVPWTRVAGVNGRALPADRIAKVYDARTNRLRARRPLTPPEIGRYLSHIAAWRTIAASGANGGVVLEDDFQIVGDFILAWQAVSRDAGDWDVVKLFGKAQMAKQTAPRKIGPSLRLFWPEEVPATMLGYAIRRDAAERLMHATQPFFRPIEEDMQFYWERDLKVAMMAPSPIADGVQDTAEGTVSDSLKVVDKKDTRTVAERVIAHVRYRMEYAGGVRRHRP